MHRVDPRLSTVLLICVILSTLFVVTIFKAPRPKDLTCVSDRYPEIFVRGSAQKGIETSFSFGVISGRDLREMTLQFAVLYEGPPIYDESGWIPAEETPLEEVASHIQIIADLRSAVSSLGGDYEVIQQAVELNGTLYDAIQYDFAGFMGIFNGDEALSQHVSTYVILKKGQSTRLFQGRTGFFLDQGRTVQYLSISVNRNKTEYLPSGMHAAPFGTIRCEEFAKNQKVSVTYEVLADEAVLPEVPPVEGRWLLQIVKGYADGRLALFIANPIPLG